MKTIYVNKNLADPMHCGNLRGIFTNLYNTNRYKTIEEDPLENHSIYVLDSAQFFEIEKYFPKNIQMLYQEFDDNHIYVMNDFSTNVEAYAPTIKNLHSSGFDISKIWIQVSFNYEKTEINSLLTDMGLPTPNIFCYNLHMDMAYDQYGRNKNEIDAIKKTVVDTPKKFTLFTRRFDILRFELLCDLIQHNLLNNFDYTFTNLHPEAIPYPHVYITKDELKNKHIPDFVTNLGNVHQWIDGLPYHDGILLDPFSNSLSLRFLKGEVNIIVETRVDNRSKHNLIITEKTFKPIMMGKPFMIYGSSGILEILRKEGFKTFHPYIDESYDMAIDSPDSKRKSVVKEIKRLSELTDAEFFNTINSEPIKKIIKFNFHHFLKIANSNRVIAKQLYNELFDLDIDNL
jgi:hypothetical protein